MNDSFVPLNRVIALSRLVFSAALIFLVPKGAGDYTDSTYGPIILSAIYFIVSLVLAVISFFEWWIDFQLKKYGIALDLIFFVFILILSNSSQNYQFYFICAAFEIHICSSIVFLRGLGRAVIPNFLIVMFISGVVVFSGRLNFSNIFVDSVPLFATVALIPVITWVASQLGRIALPRFMEQTLKSDIPLTTSMLEFARKASRAGEAVLLWVDEEDARCYFVRSGKDEVREPKTLTHFSIASEVRALVPMIFDIEKCISLQCDPRSGAIGPAVRALAGRYLFNDLGIRDGICMPLNVASHVQPWLILSALPAAGWGHLTLAIAISRELSVAADWFEETVDAKADALRQLRRTVASDLHDSVAQSLAGARFLLAALRSKMAAHSPEIEEIDQIRAALDAEHMHVRSLIRQLRNEVQEHNEVDLIVDLRTACDIIKSRWKIAIVFEEIDFRMLIPIWFSLEIQQILREAISNGVRHAGASTIFISCKKSLGKIILKIGNDFGQGGGNFERDFTPHSIRERVHSFGGTLSIETNAERTTLEIVTPMSKIGDLSSGFELRADN